MTQRSTPRHRLIVTLLVGLVGVLGLMLVSAPAVAQLPPVNPAVYQNSAQFLFCIELSGGSFIQAACSVQPKASQVLTASNPTGVGSLSNGGQCLALDAAGTVIAATCQQPIPQSQQWKLVPRTNSRTYQLQNQLLDRCLESPSSTVGAKLIAKSCSASIDRNQLFTTSHPPN